MSSLVKLRAHGRANSEINCPDLGKHHPLSTRALGHVVCLGVQNQDCLKKGGGC